MTCDWGLLVYYWATDDTNHLTRLTHLHCSIFALTMNFCWCCFWFNIRYILTNLFDVFPIFHLYVSMRIQHQSVSFFIISRLWWVFDVPSTYRYTQDTYNELGIDTNTLSEWMRTINVDNHNHSSRHIRHTIFDIRRFSFGHGNICFTPPHILFLTHK